MKLVIVESPAKAKTIEKFLGPGYQVEASYGHVRDLPRSAREMPKDASKKPWARLAVDTENGFKPIYIVPPENRKRLRELGRLMASADEILLATDEDREGESISWHLLEELKPSAPVKRIAFHEITRPAIKKALESPRDVNQRLVQAQEARRVLDRLFGYSLSPVLWKKVRTKLSAGRVQSAALRLVVEREEERQRFKTSEYWRVTAALEGAGQEFAAALAQVGDRRVAVGKDFDSTTGERLKGSKALVLDSEAAAKIAETAPDACPWRVADVERKAARQRPQPPFTTSTLQQAAANRLRFPPAKTMRLAQRLYEGVGLGAGEREGLITYMRTDSVTLSQKALTDAGRYIRKTFGDEYHQGPRRYRTKAKSAQEAHEAIRPTEIARAPKQVASFLTKDELALYRLVWTRTVASQMADAQLDRTIATICATIDGVDHLFRANGSVLRFPGFLKVYGDRREDQLLPPLKEGDQIHDGRAGSAPSRDQPHPTPAALVRTVDPTRRETKPPPRYTEASLVKKLEEEGIGRPSTYTPTISTIQDRDYVRKKNGSLVPTYVGMAVTHLLRSHFGQYVDLRFTARMEDALDDIAAGDRESRAFLDAFYNGEAKRPGLVRTIDDTLPEIDFPRVPVGADPETGDPIHVRIGRNSVYVERGAGTDAARATVPTDTLIDELTPERAAEIFAERAEADRYLGNDPATDLPVHVRVGPFGPYFQLGQGSVRSKPRRISLPDGMSPSAATLDDALKLLSLPRTVGTDPEDRVVLAGIGRYGPYVSRDGEYRNLESTEHVFTVTLDEALALLAQKKRSRRSTGKVMKVVGAHPETGVEIQLLEGRYGPYVTDGKANGSVPKDQDPMEITVEQAVELIAAAEARRKSRPSRSRGRSRTSSSSRPSGKRRPPTRRR